MPRPDQDGVRTIGPEGAPGVLLLHPWWGVTPAVEWWASQLVAVGRRVVVPDLYGGVLATTVEEAEALADSTLQDPDIRALLERCADGLDAAGAPWAAMGFSMGAFLACSLTGRPSANPTELVLLYGGQPPPAGVVQTRRVDLHVAPADPWFEDSERADVIAGFQAAGAEVRVHTYEGCGHWFAEEASPGYDPAATTLARSRITDLLHVPAR